MNKFRSKGTIVVKLGSRVEGEGKDGLGILDVSSKDDLVFTLSITSISISEVMSKGFQKNG